MTHYQPEIYHGLYFAVETTHGTEIVPADVAFERGKTISAGTTILVDILDGYLAGKPLDAPGLVYAEEGWLARLQAPGYLDCTDWTAHETQQEAVDYLSQL